MRIIFLCFLFTFKCFTVSAGFECCKSCCNSCLNVFSQVAVGNIEGNIFIDDLPQEDLQIAGIDTQFIQPHADFVYVGFNRSDDLFKFLDDAVASLRSIERSEKNVIVIDIDGTAIDRSHAVIFPVMCFYNECRQIGFSFIFMTAKPKREQLLTETFLRSHGYDGFMDVICIPDALYERCSEYAQANDFVSAARIMGNWKAEQRRLIALEKHLNICATLDDLDECLEGDFTGLKIKIPKLGSPLN